MPREKSRKTHKGRSRAVATHGGTASYLALPFFMLLYFTATLLWHTPIWVMGIYVVTSLLAFAVYGWDKAAAQAGRWRMPEARLLLLGLCCGWPGAIVAQQVLRHKSSKASFRALFWVTVVLNVAGFLALCSPLRHRLLPGG